jgi:hypothetical protein
MQHFHDEIRIKAPIEHVWACRSDGSHLDDIAPRARHTDFSGSLDQVGTTFVATGRMMGFTSRSTFTVVEVRAAAALPHPARARCWGDGLPARARGRRHSPGLRHRLRRARPPAGLVTGFLARGWERDMHRMLTDVKALTEATVPVHA